MHILIAGCGYVGGPLAQNLIQQGHLVTALRRRNPLSPSVDSRSSILDQTDSTKIDWLQQDISKPFEFSSRLELDQVIFMASPDNSQPESYRSIYIDGLKNLLKALQTLQISGQGQGNHLRFILVTSTGVYGDADGKWISEQTAPIPSTPTGKILLEAEQILQTEAGTRGIDWLKDWTVIRFGGIYGPGRMSLCRTVLEGGGALKSGPIQYTNRIHQTDAARLIQHLILQEAIEPCYLGVDHCPAPYNEVVEWIQNQRSTDVEALPYQKNSSPKRGNKRCQSHLIRQSGFQFQFPTYRDGYKPFIDRWLRDSTSFAFS